MCPPILSCAWAAGAAAPSSIRIAATHRSAAADRNFLAFVIWLSPLLCSFKTQTVDLIRSPGFLWLEVQTVVGRYLMAMLMLRWCLLCRAANDGLEGPSFGSRKPAGMLVSPLPSPDSLLTVNFHSMSCLVQLP